MRCLLNSTPREVVKVLELFNFGGVRQVIVPVAELGGLAHWFASDSFADSPQWLVNSGDSKVSVGQPQCRLASRPTRMMDAVSRQYFFDAKRDRRTGSFSLTKCTSWLADFRRHVLLSVSFVHDAFDAADVKQVPPGGRDVNDFEASTVSACTRTHFFD